MQYTADNLLLRPTLDPGDPDRILRVTPDAAGWDFIHFEVRRLATGQDWSFQVGDFELALVDLCGRFAVNSSRGQWSGIGGRKSVFQGGAHAGHVQVHQQPVGFHAGENKAGVAR